MLIGHIKIDPPLILAPMAGVTDKPFRLLCKRLGAGYAVSEMTTSDPRLWRTRKSVHRLDHEGEPAPPIAIPNLSQEQRSHDHRLHRAHSTACLLEADADVTT